MTNITTPLQTIFEMQRQSTEHGQRLFQQSLDLQRDAAETFLRNGLAAQRSAQEQSADLAHEVTNAQLDAFESAVEENESEFRTAIDEQFEQNAALIQRVLDAQFEQGADLIQRVLNAHFDALQSALENDDFDLRSTVDEQFETFVDSQNETFDELESELGEAFDDLTEQQQALVEQSVTAFLGTHRDIEQQTIEGVRQAEETAQTTQRRAEEATRSVQENAEEVAVETVEATEQQAETQAEATSESLETLADLGSTYADRLYDEGIESIDALAEADPDVVAEAGDVSETQAEEWIAAARSDT